MKIFRTILIFLICLTVIRVGMGISDDVRLELILDYLADNNYGTDHLRETFFHFSKINHELEEYQESFIDQDTGNDIRDDMDLMEKLSTFFNTVGYYFQFIGNAFVLVYRFVELLITELIYLIQIAAYLIFAVPLV